MDQFDRYLQFKKEIAKKTIEIIERYQHREQISPPKRTSKIEIAREVLKNAGTPLHISEIIERANSNHNIQLDRDSIVSAILKKVKAGKMFIRTAPNTFSLKLDVLKEKEGE